MEAVIIKNKKDIAEGLGIREGMTAFVGGGGKTTLIFLLAELLKEKGRVAVLTTTHMQWPENIPVFSEPYDEFKENDDLSESVVCFAKEELSTKKIIAPCFSPNVLRKDFRYILIEADGAKRRPIKVPASYEPVIPPETDHVIAVCGMDALGGIISETAFRTELFADFLKKKITDRITEKDVAKIFMSASGMKKGLGPGMRYTAFFNKADTIELERKAAAIAGMIPQGEAEAVVVSAIGKRE